jgi:hypothetical protein
LRDERGKFLSKVLQLCNTIIDVADLCECCAAQSLRGVAFPSALPEAHKLAHLRKSEPKRLSPLYEAHELHRLGWILPVSVPAPPDWLYQSPSLIISESFDGDPGEVCKIANRLLRRAIVFS